MLTLSRWGNTKIDFFFLHFFLLISLVLVTPELPLKNISLNGGGRPQSLNEGK